jgi:CheY-like chemotaxis protein
MSVKTCLLVTDDPDDQNAFSEAIREYSENIIVLIVLDSQKALDLIQSKKHVPDYLFLDLSMLGIRINNFLKVLDADPLLKQIPTIAYGEQVTFEKIDHAGRLRFFTKDYEYSELKKFLRTIL